MKPTPRATIARTLAELMEVSADLKTQPALARRSGVGQTTIGRILRAEVNATSENLKRLADALGVPVGRFYGESFSKTVASPTHGPTVSRIDGSNPNVASGPEIQREIPLISWVQAGRLCESVDNFEPGDAEEWLPSPRRCGVRTFALRVRGESMNPKYQDGDIIFVDPDVEAAHGKDVVVRFHENNEVTFKRLVIEGPNRYLKPLNPDWPGPKLIAINGDTTVCGVIIGKWVDT